MARVATYRDDISRDTVQDDLGIGESERLVDDRTEGRQGAIDLFPKSGRASVDVEPEPLTTEERNAFTNWNHKTGSKNASLTCSHFQVFFPVLSVPA